MKLTKPFSVITQGFGANATPFYVNGGLKGHTGIDFAADWGVPIKSAGDSYCYSVMNRDNPDLMKYRAVFTLIDDGDVTYEISYGHCSAILATPNTSVKTGQVLANIGNTGDVFVGTTEVSAADKNAGSRAGRHLHFQVRKLQKIAVDVEPPLYAKYIMDGSGLLVINGFNYIVPDYKNGYAGCVDPTPFFELSTPPIPDILPSARLAIVGNQMLATNPTQARIILAVAALLKAFNS